MFKNLKKQIKLLAKQAVLLAELELGEYCNARFKKIRAIQFVIDRLPVLRPFKKIVSSFLSVYIEEAVEMAAAIMKNKIVKFEQQRRKYD